MISKPCGRADRGCTGIVEAPGPKTLAGREYCCVRCAVHARMEAGWKPELGLTREQKQLGGKRGGKIAGLRRRKVALITAVRVMAPFFTPEFCEGLSNDQLARVKVIIGRSFRRGYRSGYRAGYAARPQRRKAPGRRAA